MEQTRNPVRLSARYCQRILQRNPKCNTAIAEWTKAKQISKTIRLLRMFQNDGSIIVVLSPTHVNHRRKYLCILLNCPGCQQIPYFCL
jgi:hypothetical protein